MSAAPPSRGEAPTFTIYTIPTGDGGEKQVPECDIVCVNSRNGLDDAVHEMYYVEKPANAPPELLPKLQMARLTDVIPQYSYNGIFLRLIEKHASTSKKRKITLVASTESGSKQAIDCFDKLLKPLFAHFRLDPLDVELFPTTSASSISELAQATIAPRAQTGVPQTIILVSGDGGVVDLVNSLYDAVISPKSKMKPGPSKYYTKPQIALLPFGTGNALAHSARITSDRTLGLSNMTRGTPHPLPVFKVTLPAGTYAVDGQGQRVPSTTPAADQVYPPPPVIVYGAVVFSWALHSTLVADSDTPEYRKHGAARFGMAAKELLFPPDGSPCHQFKGRLSYRRRTGRNGETLEWVDIMREAHAYVLLTMVSHLESNFCISPLSQPLDGKLRLVHFDVGQQGGEAVMSIMEQAYDGGKHVAEKGVGYEEAIGLRLEILEESERWRRVCIDGKIYVVPTGGVIWVAREEHELIDLIVKDWEH